MSWDQIIGNVSEQLPHFNDYLLKEFRKEQVDSFPEYVSGIFKEAIQLFKGELEYLGYKTLSPEKELEFIANNKLMHGRYNIQRSELELVQYNFKFHNQFYDVNLYLPYMYNGRLIINDTNYCPQFAIIERMITRITDGVIIKVMRSPIQFCRGDTKVFKDTRGNEYCESVIIVNAFYRKERRSKHKTPLILYLLVKFDFDHVINVTLGLPVGSITFVEKDDPESTQYTYFKCRENIYLRCETASVMQDHFARRLVASLLVILERSKNYNISMLYNKTFYKTILGRNLYDDSVSAALAADHANGHLDSLSTYLDQQTKRRLALQNPPLYCDDIFDLFVAAFVNIDEWLIRYSANDLFSKRIGGIDRFVSCIEKIIFHKFYDALKRNHSPNEKAISSMLRISPLAIKDIYNNKEMQVANALYNDNELIDCQIKKIRQSSTQENASSKHTKLIGDKEHQFHPSFVAIESPLAISSSSPCITGDINPFAVIDSNGYFQKDKMPWYAAVEPLSKYLS